MRDPSQVDPYARLVGRWENSRRHADPNDALIERIKINDVETAPGGQNDPPSFRGPIIRHVRQLALRAPALQTADHEKDGPAARYVAQEDSLRSRVDVTATKIAKKSL